MLERVIAAGHGGQGLMFIGKLLAWAMMSRGFNVTYIPSYGAEVRGGTSNCHVKISSERIYSPIVEEAESLIVMNEPSLVKFCGFLGKDGCLFLNTSMAAAEDVPSGLRVVGVPATEIASNLGDVRVANMVMFGAYNAVKGYLETGQIKEALANASGGKGLDMLAMNLEAVAGGAAAAGGKSA